MGYNLIESEPIAEEEGVGDSVQVEENTEDVESNGICVERIFADEEEAYKTYNSYAFAKGFKFCRARPQSPK